MKNSVDKVTRLEQAVEISKDLKESREQLQIQAMLSLLAEKFMMDEERLLKLKGVLNMTLVAEMIREDKAIEIAKNFLRLKTAKDTVIKATGLDESKIDELQTEIDKE